MENTKLNAWGVPDFLEFVTASAATWKWKLRDSAESYPTEDRDQQKNVFSVPLQLW